MTQWDERMTVCCREETIFDYIKDIIVAYIHISHWLLVRYHSYWIFSLDHFFAWKEWITCEIKLNKKSKYFVQCNFIFRFFRNHIYDETEQVNHHRKFHGNSTIKIRYPKSLTCNLTSTFLCGRKDCYPTSSIQKQN